MPPETDMAEFPDIPDFLDRTRPASSPRLDPKLRTLAPPTRAEVQKRRRTAAVASGAWLAVQLAVFGVRRDLGELPAYYVGAMIAAPCAAGLFVVIASLHPGRFGLGLRAPLLVVLSLLGPAAFLIVALVTPITEPTPGAGILADSSCLNAIVAWALLPMLAAALVLRRTFASAASSRSALLGGGIGLIAGSLFALHCSNTERLHVALAHGGAVGLVALAGGLLLARSTRI